MPFYDERPQVADLTNLSDADGPAVTPSLADTFGAAFRTQNVVGSFLSSRGQVDPYRVEEGFDPIDYIKDDNRYAPYAEEFAGITNRTAADAKKLQIDREEQDRRTLDAAGGMGVVAQMAAGVVDIPTLLPLGGAALGRTLGMVTGTAVGAGLDAAVSEAGLQATQATRTTEETLLNVGGSVVLGGALGALVGRYMTATSGLALSRKIEQQAAEFDGVDDAFAAAGARSVGAAARDTGPITLKDEALISKLPIINRQDPLIRLQLSPLTSGRQTVRQLAETPLEYAENARGVATEAGGSVETRIKMWNAPLAKSLREIDTHYARYFHNTPEPTAWQRRLSPAISEWDRFRGGQKLTFKQFKEEVGRAAYLGGKHEIPEVATAAKAYRVLDDELKRAAIDARLFPEDVEVAGDISHRFRMYNKEKIVAERGRFADILTDYFSSKQAAAGFRAEEVRLGNKIVELDKLRESFERLDERVAGIDRRLTERQSWRQARTTSLDKMRQTRLGAIKERAPKPMVDMLRGADENAAMVQAVKEARAGQRAAGKKKSFAERQPVLALIKSKGGVRVGSQLDSALRAMDVTPKTHPGLFVKKGGIGDLDNFVASEDDFLAGLPVDDTGMYVDPRELYEAIRAELGGAPLKSADEIAAEEYLDNIDRVASEWLEAVGLPQNATVKDVREFIARVLGAEKDLDGLDVSISKLERELEEFDAAGDKIVNEREITSAQAKVLRDRMDVLDSELEQVGDMANASPRVSIVVDHARARRDLFKAKLQERTLNQRIEAIERVRAEGRANDDILAELSAKTVERDRASANVAKLKERADKLEKSAPSRGDLESAEEFATLSTLEIRSLADEVIDNILGHADGRVPYEIVSGPRGPLKERLLKIETAKIHDFVENDIETVMRAQVRTMSADVELAKKFGSVDLKEEIRKVNDEANAKANSAKNKDEAKAIEKARTDAIRDIEGIRDRLRGTYRLPADPSSLVVRAGRVARNLNYVRLLGGMTISAVPDMAKVVFTHGLTSTFRDGFVPMIRNFQAFRLAAGEVKAAGAALDMVLDSRTMAMADVVDEFGHHSKFERGLSALSSKFGVVSLMAPWNAAMKQFAGLVTMNNILRATQRVGAGQGSEKQIRNLAASGIDAQMARRIARQFAEHGEDIDGTLVAKGEAWTDRGALEAFRAAVVREVDRIIVTPGQDKPLWMSTELGKTIGQFKSFAVSTMQRTMLAGLQQRDAATLNGVMLMMGLGAVSYYLKQVTAGQPVTDSPAVWVAEAFDRSGVAGWLMEVNNISEKATRGRVGVSALTGQQISRYATRNVTGAFLGPSADAVADIFQVSGSIFAGDMTKSDLRRARQLVPLQNLFYLRTLFNTVEEATGDTLGLPDTRRQ